MHRLYIVGAHDRVGGSPAVDWIRDRMIEISRLRAINPPLDVFRAMNGDSAGTTGVLDMDGIARTRREASSASL